MARIHDPIVLDSAYQMPSLDVLLGTRVSHDIYSSIDNTGHKSFFGAEFDHMREDFLNRHVRPMEVLSLELASTVNKIINPDYFRPLISMADFESTPSCMEMAILLYEPVRQLALDGRCESFGWNPESLPEDAYGRLLSNFECKDVEAASDPEGYYDIEATMWSGDPDLDDDELYAIRKTRQFIKSVILETTDRDPCAIGVPRG